MAKMNSTFSFSGTFNGVTQVHSRLYGTHMRRKRGTVKEASLNKSLQKSVDLLRLANPTAKVIKDALDPFRQDFRDGSMWGRLVGLFKTHLRNHAKVDFTILKDFEFYHKIPFGTRFAANAKVSIRQEEEPALHLELTSRCLHDLQKVNATHYQQTVVVVFLDASQQAITRFDQVMFPVQEETYYNEAIEKECTKIKSQTQNSQWTIPPESKTAVIAVKCELYDNGQPLILVKHKGLKVVQVCKLELEPSEVT